MKSVNLFIALAICLIANTVRAQGVYLKFTQYGTGSSTGPVATEGMGPDKSVRDAGRTVNLRDYIEVASLQFDGEQTLNIGSQSSGSGAGKVTFNPLTITKPVDALTPKLFQFMCSGTPYKYIEILFVKSTGIPQPSVYYKVLLKLGAVKTQAVSSVSDCTDGCAVESDSFEYGAMIQYYYKEQPDGSFVPLAPTGWNRVKNVSDTDPTTPVN